MIRWLALGLAALTAPASGQTVLFSGSVRSPDGVPVAGATVTARGFFLGLGPIIGTATTDNDGRYTLTSMTSCGLACIASATAPGLVVAPAQLVFAAGATDRDFIAAVPATITAIVQSGSAPVVGLRPFITFRDPQPQPPMVEELGSGVWRFRNVFPAPLHLCAQSDDDVFVGTCHGDQVMPFTNDVSDLAAFLPAEGMDHTEVLQLRVGATLTGIITDAYRLRPLAETPLQVSLFNFSGTTSRVIPLRTDENGRYRIGGLPPGSYRLQANVPSPYFTPMRYPGIDCLQPHDCFGNSGSYVSVGGSATVDYLGFDLFPGTVVTGRVSRLGSGGPLQDIEVRAYRAPFGPEAPPVATARTGSDGAYALAHLPPFMAMKLGTANTSGLADVGWPSAPCGTAECVGGESFGTRPGVMSMAFDFELSPAHAISGTVRLPGAPVDADEASITLLRYDGGAWWTVWRKSVAIGQSYSTRGLSAGTYFARAQIGASCLVHADQPCGPGSLPNPTTATPIVIPDSAGTFSGVDFEFLPDPLFSAGFEPAALSRPAAPAR